MTNVLSLKGTYMLLLQIANKLGLLKNIYFYNTPLVIMYSYIVSFAINVKSGIRWSIITTDIYGL
jgi:hypothetical protein